MELAAVVDARPRQMMHKVEGFGLVESPSGLERSPLPYLIVTSGVGDHGEAPGEDRGFDVNELWLAPMGNPRRKRGVARIDGRGGIGAID